MLTTCRSNSQIVTQFVESIAETTRRLKVLEAMHRVAALLDWSMTLLHKVVQILVLAMQNLTTDDPANCLRVGRVLVCSYSKWLLPSTIDQTS